MIVYDPEALGLEVRGFSGLEASCLCPFHGDSNPSATFNVKEGLFYCFACHESAIPEDIARTVGGQVQMTHLSSLAHLGPDVGESDDDLEWRHMLLSPPAAGHPYLGERKVSDRLANALGLLADEERIIFPIRNKFGKVTGAQVRNFRREPKYMFYGERQPVWPVENLRRNERTYVVEGVFGVLRCMSAGLNSVAVMGAGSIKKALPYFDGRSAIVAFDDDPAGWLGAGKLTACRLPAIFPPFEADEISAKEWRNVDGMIDDLVVWSPIPFAERSGNYKSFMAKVNRFRRQALGKYVKPIS